MKEILWNYCRYKYSQLLFERAKEIIEKTENKKLQEKKELLFSITDFN